MTGKHGVDLFKTAVDLRLLCCNVRKVRPLTKHLHTLDAWVTGLRRDQWASRTNIRKVEIDHDHGAIVKLNPLAEWDESEVWDYVRERDVPYHSLYDQGYTSIGCAPCTRAIAPGEASRAGRWWWESNAPEGVRDPLLDRERRARARAARAARGARGERAAISRRRRGGRGRPRPRRRRCSRWCRTRRAAAGSPTSSRRVDEGEISGDEADALAELLELGLQTGRIRSTLRARRASRPRWRSTAGCRPGAS